MTSTPFFLRGGNSRRRRGNEQGGIALEEYHDEHEKEPESEAEPPSDGIVSNQDFDHNDPDHNDADIEDVDHLHEDLGDHMDDHHFEGDGHDHASLLTRTQASSKGYDVDAGKDPICWLTAGTTSPTLGTSDVSHYPYVWHTSFADDFYAEETAMMQSCFDGFELEIQAPPLEEREEFGRLYTDTEYTFRVRGRLDVSEIQRMMVNENIGVYGESRDPTTGALVVSPRVSIEVIFCRLRTVGGGLCSPFVYQHDIHGDSHVEENDGMIHEHGMELHGDSHDGGEEEDEDHHMHESELEEEGEDHHHADEENAHSEDDHAFLQSEVIVFDIPPNRKIIDLNADIPFSMVEDETVFAIAAVRTLLSPGDSSVVYKFDASNIVVERALQYETPPQINTISQGTLGFSYALIGLVGIGISALFLLVVKHRKHKVFLLSQGSFLLVFLASGLVATAASFLLNPKTDLYCQLYSPLIVIPLQLMVAVVTCRLWRIHTLMRPLMQWADNHQKILSARGARRAARRWLPKFDSTSGNSSSSQAGSSETKFTVSKRGKVQSSATSLRRKVTAKHLSIYIFLITLPQVVVQCLIGTISPMSSEIYWNDDMSVGRPRCRSSIGVFNWLPYLIFFVSVLVLLAVAFRTRNLPSLFNEAGSMFSSVAITVCVAAIGIALILSTHTPTSSPDVGYLVSVVIVLVFTGQLSFRCVYPKLQLVWSGEAVVVSKLFQSKKSLGPETSASALHNGGRTVVPSKVGVEPTSHAGPQSQASNAHLPNTSTITFDEAAHHHEVVSGENENGHDQERRRHVAFSSTATDITHESIHISEEGLPPKELTMMMLQLSQQISKNNSRTLSGMRVSRGEWQEMKDAIVRMGNIFDQDVKFDWDNSVEQTPNEKNA